jgi:thioredoxin-like negative regulator of GroEL
LLGPRLEEIIAGSEGKVLMAKVDIDENVELAMKYNVSTFVAFSCNLDLNILLYL